MQENFNNENFENKVQLWGWIHKDKGNKNQAAKKVQTSSRFIVSFHKACYLTCYLTYYLTGLVSKLEGIARELSLI
ncbi:hypothetical protein GCM10010099_20050 [Streptomyces cinereus]|nr:hypothetical protein GCM10010099_20050 [Streptomyces cinereus]